MVIASFNSFLYLAIRYYFYSILLPVLGLKFILKLASLISLGLLRMMILTSLLAFYTILTLYLIIPIISSFVKKHLSTLFYIVVILL